MVLSQARATGVHSKIDSRKIAIHQHTVMEPSTIAALRKKIVGNSREYMKRMENLMEVRAKVYIISHAIKAYICQLMKYWSYIRRVLTLDTLLILIGLVSSTYSIFLPRSCCTANLKFSIMLWVYPEIMVLPSYPQRYLQKDNIQETVNAVSVSILPDSLTDLPETRR